MTTILPISAVVPTRDRAQVLERTLASLIGQNVLPAQLIVVDGSQHDGTRGTVERWAATVESQCEVVYQRASQIGAAVQRNQGVATATQPFIWFFDDDIVLESDCVKRLWQAIESDDVLGGVNAMITNQQYGAPGRLTRLLYRTLNGRHRSTYAGMCIGPALNVLPDDNPDLPAVVPVEWLNTTCTLYRREALPVPAFQSHFTGYSLLEDLALSLTVGKNWKLANARTARIYHNSQTSDYKADQATIAKMELVNRHFVMTLILGRTAALDYAKLILLETFGVTTPLASPGAWRSLPSTLYGKAQAIRSIIRRQNRNGSDSLLAGKSKSVVPN